jgi:hypothetical protein
MNISKIKEVPSSCKYKPVPKICSVAVSASNQRIKDNPFLEISTKKIEKNSTVLFEKNIIFEFF